jgi:hypothetical protein
MRYGLTNHHKYNLELDLICKITKGGIFWKNILLSAINIV